MKSATLAPASGLRRMAQADVLRVLSWRNHPEVRRYMYTQQEIAEADHRRWFEAASQDALRHLLIFEVHGEPLGYVNLTETLHGRFADWGFYLAPNAARGTGSQLGAAVLGYAFDTLGLHKLCGEVLGFNERSAQFHEKLGFLKEGVLRQQHFDGNSYHDVIRYGLLAAEWMATRSKANV